MEESNKNKENHLKIFLSVVFVLVLVVSVVGITYSLFSFSKTGSAQNTISSGSITCSLNEETAISITAAHPIDDNTGKTLAVGTIAGYSQGYFDSTLSCTCNGTCNGTYELYAMQVSTTPALDTQYVKTYLTNGETTESVLRDVTTYNNLETAAADAAGKKLYEGSISGTFSQKFRLRLWVADNYTVVNNAASNSFKAKLYAKIAA